MLKVGSSRTSLFQEELGEGEGFRRAAIAT